MESQISESLKQTHNNNNIVWLKTNEKREILALTSPSNTSDLQGGIIILADLHQNPDWPIIVHGLRTKLPNFGWETLSIQLPVPTINPSNNEMDQIYELIRQRLESSITHFKNKNISNIALIGVNQSANFALKFIASKNKETPDIQSLITIRAFDSDWLTSSELVKNISINTLDIYPEHDSNMVLQSAQKRLIATNFAGKLNGQSPTLNLSPKVKKLAINKTGNLRYRQKIINGANYPFDNQEDTLIKIIRGWLAIYTAGRKISVN